MTLQDYQVLPILAPTAGVMRLADDNTPDMPPNAAKDGRNFDLRTDKHRSIWGTTRIFQTLEAGAVRVFYAMGSKIYYQVAGTIKSIDYTGGVLS